MSSVAYLTEVAEEATLFAYRAAGSQGLRNPSRVQECFRDIMTGGRHLFVDKKSYEEFTKTTLGRDPGLAKAARQRLPCARLS